ncbi:TlpA family protein disulfide reductase [Dyella ginsengisoli]|uniref:TlpA family protein disulfide reductase n=1 Tax=Dyella ginsengisoli TaxID=363848 RepID=A0ABW8JWD8_9GAMM
MRRMAVLFACLLTCTGALATSTLQPGDTPPDALGVTRDGTHLTLSSMRGKVVVVSFWATWCGYCMKELPTLANIQQVATQRHLPLQIVAVNHMESVRTFATVARNMHRILPDLLMSRDGDGSVGRPYGSDDGIPVMAMFQRDGTLVHLHVGYDESDLDGILAEINALVAQQPAAPGATQAPASP